MKLPRKLKKPKKTGIQLFNFFVLTLGILQITHNRHHALIHMFSSPPLGSTQTLQGMGSDAHESVPGSAQTHAELLADPQSQGS